MAAPNSFRDPYWRDLASVTESKVGLPSGLLASIVTRGERSNADQVSEAGARTPFQIIPSTRDAALKKWGVDAYLSPENAAEVSARLLKDSLDRNRGSVSAAVAEYHGGLDRANWGPRTRSYVARVLNQPKEEAATGSAFDRATAQQKSTTGTKSAIASVYEAYKSGKMSDEEAQQFEQDVGAGLVMLPRGAALKSQPTKAPNEPPQATMLPQAVTDAYTSGQLSDQEREDLEADIKAGLVKLPPKKSDLIPTGQPGETRPTEQPIIQQPKTPTIGERAIGAGEAALSTSTGMVHGLAGTIAGTVEGITKSIMDGTYGTQEGVKNTERLAAEYAQAMTYEPRTATGQEYIKKSGEVMQQLVPLGGLGGEMAMLGRGIEAAAPAIQTATAAGAQRAGQAAVGAAEAIKKPVVSAAEAVKSAPRKAGEALGFIEPQQAAPVVTDRVSMGAAAMPSDLIRTTKAETLPVPISLTKGAATRDAAQLAFEKEQTKNPTLGAPLRQRVEENNLQALQNFDALIDMTEAEAPDLSTTGTRVTKALSDGHKQAKAKVNVLYKQAEKSPEAQAIADPNLVATIGEGENAINGSLVDYVNDRLSGVEPAVAEAAKKQLLRFGIAEEDASGKLIGKPATVKQLEDFRSEMSGAGNATVPRQIRDETIIKKLVDATTEPVAGPLFKAARAERTAMARKFENRAVVARLIQNVRGMDDPRVAADQVFQKSILNSSPEEITFLKRVLHTTGEDGKQAWKELQGALVRNIRDEATRGMGMDSADRPIVSPAKLNQAVQTLDKNGRLDVVLGKQRAAIVRDLNDVVRYVNTTPPGTLINNSGTVGTLFAAITEAGLMGYATGFSAPVFTGLKALAKQINNNKTKAKIQDALNTKPKF